MPGFVGSKGYKIVRKGVFKNPKTKYSMKYENKYTEKHKQHAIFMN